MKVEVAKSAGFCFGVQRAVDSVYSEIEKGKKLKNRKEKSEPVNCQIQF